MVIERGRKTYQKKTKTLTESFGNISSKLLIQCCVVCCPHMVIMIYLSVMIQKYFAVAMQNNIIIRFYTVSVWPTKSLLRCQTDHCEEIG